MTRCCRRLRSRREILLLPPLICIFQTRGEDFFLSYIYILYYIPRFCQWDVPRPVKIMSPVVYFYSLEKRKKRGKIPHGGGGGGNCPFFGTLRAFGLLTQERKVEIFKLPPHFPSIMTGNERAG